MLAVLGDVHGQRTEYKEICGRLNANGYDTVQLGDFGFGYEYRRLMKDEKFDLSRNRFFRGNHDQYDYTTLEDNQRCVDRFTQFNLGEYGTRTVGGVPFYFVRGAFSIDYKDRVLFRSWWPNEEISVKDWDEVIEDYSQAKPHLMITHDLPQTVGHDGKLKTAGILERFGYRYESFSTNTGVLLQKLFEIHQPELWIFGHYHMNWTAKVNGTQFQCVPILGTYLVPKGF